jgi:hypothetical protein
MRLTVLFMFAFTGALIVNAADLAVKVKLRWADVDFKNRKCTRVYEPLRSHSGKP